MLGPLFETTIKEWLCMLILSITTAVGCSGLERVAVPGRRTGTKWYETSLAYVIPVVCRPFPYYTVTPQVHRVQARTL